MTGSSSNLSEARPISTPKSLPTSLKTAGAGRPRPFTSTFQIQTEIAKDRRKTADLCRRFAVVHGRAPRSSSSHARSKEKSNEEADSLPGHCRQSRRRANPPDRREGHERET